MILPPKKSSFAPRVRHTRKVTRPKGDSLGRPGRLAVVTSYYNPVNCERMKRNYDAFASGLNAPLFVAELAYDGVFAIPGAVRFTGCRDTQLLWQKERLLNLAISQVPAEYDALAWVDADVILQNPQWVEQTLDMLEFNHVGQIWSHSEERHDANTYTIRPSCSYAYASGLEDHFDLGRYHPGFAWAIRRDSLDAIGGLMEMNVVGNGDTHMCRGWFDEGLWTDRFVSPVWMLQADEWRSRATRIVRGRVGCVPGVVTHLWHGDRTKRKYVDRLSYLGDHDFDPSSDLEIQNGLLTWTPAAMSQKTEMVRKVGNYFKERQTDPSCSESAFTGLAPPV